MKQFILTLSLLPLMASVAGAQTVATALGGATGYQAIVNDSTTGTTANLLACATSANPTTAVTCATTVTTGILGICATNCGTSGSPNPIIAGTTGQIMACVFDGGTTAGDFVIPSTTVAGNCHDSGSPTSVPAVNIGRVLSTNASGGTYNIVWRGTIDASAASTPNFTTGWTVSGATSGGIPYFDSATDSKSSGVLASNQFVLGGGASNPPTTSFSTVPVANGGTGATAFGATIGQVIVQGSTSTSPLSASNLVITSNTLTSNASTSNVLIQGPSGGSLNGAVGSLAFGGVLNANTGANTSSSVVGIFAGIASATTGGHHQGWWFAAGAYAKGTAQTNFLVQTIAGTTAEASTDCSTTCTIPIGIGWQGTGTVAYVVNAGYFPVTATAAVTIGDLVATSTSVAGQVTDCASQTSCSTGTVIGRVYSTSGTWIIPNGNGAGGTSQLITSTLPIVKLANLY